MNQFDNIFKFSFILLLFALFIVIEVSSAYNINFVSIELINKFDMSLIYKMNSSGPSIDPWGIFIKLQKYCPYWLYNLYSLIYISYSSILRISYMVLVGLVNRIPIIIIIIESVILVSMVFLDICISYVNVAELLWRAETFCFLCRPETFIF